ncbi:hypothetical protein VNO80_14609 [Phaseolus coccineus]|uniref:Uncharacterized protein n=1 Tax=Phaseolus coccineus TaxID=3886 RepID=A0AAN9R223_PHACN
METLYQWRLWNCNTVVLLFNFLNFLAFFFPCQWKSYGFSDRKLLHSLSNALFLSKFLTYTLYTFTLA